MRIHAAPTGRRLNLAAGATGLFVVVEFLVGWSAPSLALISDAGHNLTDMAALLLSAWAFAMAAKPADPDRSFGYHRVGVLAALANALVLVLLAVYIFVGAARRLVHPEAVASWPMIIVAAVAFGLYLVVALKLHGASHDDANVRSAFIHMVGDALSSVGVLLAGIAVLLSGASWRDPAVSILIGGFILWSSWGIIRETVDILLEGTPSGLRLAEVARAIDRVPGVGNVHDLHTLRTCWESCSPAGLIPKTPPGLPTSSRYW